ncbi:MAG: hypothetical protein AMXMBFR23_09550 [Chloroflexota bacterium]
MRRLLRGAGVLAICFAAVAYLGSRDLGGALLVGGIAGGVSFVAFAIATLHDRHVR